MYIIDWADDAVGLYDENGNCLAICSSVCYAEMILSEIANSVVWC